MRYNGKKVPVVECETEVVLRNKKTGHEYNSAKRDDIADPNTDTVYEDVTRSVKIKVADMPPLETGSTNNGVLKTQQARQMLKKVVWNL